MTRRQFNSRSGAATVAGGGIVFFPAGTYVIDGAKNTDLSTGKTYGVALKSNIIFARRGLAEHSSPEGQLDGQ